MAHYWHHKPYTLSVYSFPPLPVVGGGVLYPQNKYVTVTPTNTDFTHFIAKGFRIVIQNCPIIEMITKSAESVEHIEQVVFFYTCIINKPVKYNEKEFNYFILSAYHCVHS